MIKSDLSLKWDAALYAERLGRDRERPTESYKVPFFEAAEYYAPERGTLLRVMAAMTTQLSSVNHYGPEGHREGKKRFVLDQVDNRLISVLDRVGLAVEIHAGQNPQGWASPNFFVERCLGYGYVFGDEGARVEVNPSARTASIDTGDTAYRLRRTNFRGRENPDWQTTTDVILDGVALPLAGMPMKAAERHADQIVKAFDLRLDQVFEGVKSQFRAASAR